MFKFYNNKNNFNPNLDIDSFIYKIDSINSKNYPYLKHFSASEIYKWNGILTSLSSNFGKMSSGNIVHIFQDGNETLTDMLKEINKAKESIFLEMYIFDDSPVAEIFANALKIASLRGCKIVLLLDYIGSIRFSSKIQRELEELGVEIHFFNPLRLNNSIGPITYRNHKKLLIIDQKTAFCGSLNICRNSVGEDLGGDGGYIDVSVKLNGPSVYDLCMSFLGSLKIANVHIDGLTISERAEPIPGGSIVQIFESNTRKNKKDVLNSLLLVISKASNSIHLSTSYFIPPGSLRRSLISAKNRNLNIRMLLSGNSDLPGDTSSTYYILKKFFRSRFAKPFRDNFRVFMTKNRHYHGKVMVVDDIWSSIGSFNWDRLSSRRNMELTLGIFDPLVAHKLKQIQLENEKESYEYTRNDSLNRLKILKMYDCITYHIARFSEGNLVDGLSNERFNVVFKKTFIRTFVDQNVSEMFLTSNISSV
ncbi:PLD-like domain protein [Theileria parva strain Muguga]|uniref:Cardiolipin synthetase, putative n=1 Tax=Theileria parva TaxID=5875 RepID=Q4N2L9_THEPA|nr:PLD-like domain protein [Theileria parva strain Muguga]EAN31681.1 PLD-like domain protein [Theileria parva strain Muguga]|eukprot:XP_763964.1 cardiolipin synthetase [Theileria parva strain Muguga]